MKRNLFVMVLGLLATVALAQTGGKDRVEVVYFHGKQRCATCLAIERHAREVVETSFADEVKQGRVVFKVVDISTPEGAKVAKAYRVTWSSLFVNGWKAGKESRHNLTPFAFQKARKQADEFKKGVEEKVNEQLK